MILLAIKLQAPPSKKYWNIEPSTDDKGNPTGELYLYGYVTDEKWYEEDVTPKGLIDSLNALGAISELNVHLFSNGGDVFSGNAIYSILKQRKETVNVYIEGIAASIATVIAMAADNLYIDKNAMFMIHNVMIGGFFALLNKTDLQKMIADLDRTSAVTIKAYTDRTGMTDEQIYALLDANNGDGTWFNAEEAVDAGFCDAITPDAKAPADKVAMIRPNVYSCRGHEIDMSIYKHAPKLAAVYQTSRAVKKKAQNGGKQIMGKLIKPKMEILNITCPHCQGKLNLDTSNADAPVVSADPTEVSTVATPQNKSTAVYKNELYTITCPLCGGDFEIDTTPDAEATPMAPPNTDPIPQAANKRGLFARAKASLSAKATAKPKAVAKPKMQTQEVTLVCSECGAEFVVEVDPTIEAAEVTCPSCGTLLDINTNGGGGGTEPNNDDSTSGDVIIAQNAVQKERNRLMKLDGLTKTFPQYQNAIEQFKQNGSSVECANAWIVQALAANPSGRTAQSAYLAGAQRDSQTMKGLGGAAAPGKHSSTVTTIQDEIKRRRGIKQ